MNLRSRVERLAKALGADEAEQDRLRLEQQKRRRAAVLRWFVRSIPARFEEAACAALEPHIDEYTHRRWVGRDAHLLARVADGLNWHGWAPSPLPAAWLEAVFAHPTADMAACTQCGFMHPSGGVDWIDCRKVHLPPRFTSCLHCGGEVGDGVLAYYHAHSRRHPWGDTAPGAFLLAGGDPADYGPEVPR